MGGEDRGDGGGVGPGPRRSPSGRGRGGAGLAGQRLLSHRLNPVTVERVRMFLSYHHCIRLQKEECALFSAIIWIDSVSVLIVSSFSSFLDIANTGTIV